MKKSLKFETITPIKRFIGRGHELNRLRVVLSQQESSILIVHGRRRVGKTEMLEQVLKSKRVLKFEGLENQNVTAQRRSFLDQLSNYTGNIDIAKLSFKTWREVFVKLAQELQNQKNVVVYLEELQWLANYRKDLVSDLKFVWDNYLRKLKGFKLILCGSATSFMVKKVLRSKALYSRSINEIPLAPFSLKEAGEFLSHYSKAHSLEAYLLFGGIPEYLRYVKNYSTPQEALNNEAFVVGGYFLTEFERVFISSLSQYETHRQIVKAFSNRNFYTRGQLAKKISVAAGGTLTQVLQDLELIGLVATSKPYGGGARLYYLRDPYLNCYLKLIEPWSNSINSQRSVGFAINHQALAQYLGYAFERFCREKHYILAHILGISGIEYSYGPYEIRKDGLGFQFDLVFDRKDRCLTLFEIKFQKFDLSTSVINEFEARLAKVKVPKNYNIQKVLVSGGPVSRALKESSYFDRIIELEELFI